MNCLDCSEDLSGLIFGEFLLEKELKLHEHLVDCDQCREEYISLSVVNTELDLALNENSTASGLGEERVLGLKRAFGKEVPQKSNKVHKTNIIPFIITTLAACIVIVFVYPRNGASKVNVAKNDKVLPEQSESKSKPKTKMRADKEINQMIAAEELAPKTKMKTEFLRAAELETISSDRLESSASVVASDQKLAKKLVKQARSISSSNKEAPSRLLRAREVKADAMVAPLNVLNLNEHLKRWQQKNKSDPKIKKVVSYLSSLKQGMITLKPAKGQTGETATFYKIIIHDKIKKPIEYGIISIHNGDVASFESLMRKGK